MRVLFRSVDVGRRALERCVDRRPLRPHPLVHVLGREVGEVRPAPEQGRDIAALARAAQRLGDIVADAGEAIEIAVDDRLRLAPVAAQPSGKAERSEEHTSELQSLMRNSYAVICLKKKKLIDKAIR